MINSDDLSLPIGNKVPSVNVPAFFELLHGRQPDHEPVGVEGCAVNLELALIREDRDAYLVARLGDQIVSIQGVHPSALAEYSEHFTHSKPSPQKARDQELREQRKQEAMERAEQLKAEKEAAKRRWEERAKREREEAEAHYARYV